jgi:hypothetical protein
MPPPHSSGGWRSEWRCLSRVPAISIAFGTALFLFHFVVIQQYGFHGDELYFLVCGQRAAWGYVDHPPLVPMIARASTGLFGLNLFAFRMPLAVALGVGCALTGWLARRLGAGRFGEFLAALCFVAAPMMLRVGAFLNIPVFEVVFWLVIAHLLVSLLKSGTPRWWLAIGAVAGVALLNKHTTLFLGTGLAAGLLLTPRRKDLLTPWPWLGGALALLFFLPNLIWQYQNNWATLEFVRSINASIMQQMSRVEFVLTQVILMNAFVAVVCLAGVWFYFRDPAGKPFRALGWVFVTVFAIMLTLQAKVYYLLPAYPLVIAAGAVVLERRAWPVRATLCTGIAAMGIIFVPIMCPVSTLDWKERYIARVLGFMLDDPRDLTFDFHNQLGRPEEIAALARIYESLPPGERAECAVLTHEYDSVSNLILFGAARGLPTAISGNNSHYLWGPQGASGNCIIALGYREEFLRGYFGEVQPVAELDTHPKKTIHLCRKPAKPLAEGWPYFKTFH